MPHHAKAGSIGYSGFAIFCDFCVFCGQKKRAATKDALIQNNAEQTPSCLELFRG